MNEYGQPGFDPSLLVEPQTESTHPVLAKLYEQIATLTEQVANLEKINAEKANEIYKSANDFRNYKFKLENVLRTVANDNPESVDAILEVAEGMDIELVNTKDFVVNVSFSITVSKPFGEDFDLGEYDFDATLESYDHEFEVNSTDVVYINED